MNIFEQLASQNDSTQWDDVIEASPSNSQTPFVSPTASLSGSGNVFDQLAEKEKSREENPFGFLETAKDIGEQVASKGISGIGGAYGNLLDTFGLQLKSGQQLPSAEATFDIQQAILDKINRGEKVSVEELNFLSDEGVSYPRLPTSKEIQEFTGIGEGKTTLGRIAGRGAQLAGEGLATGGGAKTLLGMGLGGIGGQGIREAGGPELLASTFEIGSSLAPSVITKKLAPLSRSGKEIVEAGRKIGLQEKNIAPLLQSEAKTALIAPVARKGSRTKKVFSELKEKLGDSYNAIKATPEAKGKLPNTDQLSLRKQFGEIRNELSKTLAPSPDKQSALDYIEKSLDTLRNTDVTPEYLVNFWQDINKSVKWNSINGGKKALAKLKNPIAQTLEKVSPQLAEDFELTNQLYSKYAQISKKLKPDLVDSFVNKGEIVSAIPSGIALAQGNPLPLLGLGGEVATRLLAREMLVNPYFQTIAGKLVKNFNSGSVKGVESTVKQVKDYMSRKHPNENWEFLTQSRED